MAKRSSSSTRSPSSRPLNRLLQTLPAAEWRRLEPDMESLMVRTKEVLHRAGEKLKHVYFPNSGVFSITTVLPDGSMVEVATVGDEGLMGIEAFFGAESLSHGESFLQVPDKTHRAPASAAGASVTRIGVAAFRREIARSGALHALMGRYAQTVLAQMMQSTACNARHQVQKRCARWLLTTHDRMHRQDFHLSHEFLAMMLGVRRPTVTIVAGTLQQAGLISYKHGKVTVLDRKGLEAASCPCYTVIRHHFDRMAN